MLHFLVLKLVKKFVSCLRRADYATAAVEVEDKDINKIVVAVVLDGKKTLRPLKKFLTIFEVFRSLHKYSLMYLSFILKENLY